MNLTQSQYCISQLNLTLNKVSKRISKMCSKMTFFKSSDYFWLKKKKEQLYSKLIMAAFALLWTIQYFTLQSSPITLVHENGRTCLDGMEVDFPKMMHKSIISTGCYKICQTVVCCVHHSLLLRTSLKDGELCHVNSALILLMALFLFLLN